jgi:uncharacterized protein (TIGR02996 family)
MERELEALVLAKPDDDAPRLVMADWLSDRRDPRGELIHAQCALARMTPGDVAAEALEERVVDLLAEHERRWSAPVRELGGLDRDADAVSFVRGFVESVTLDASLVPGTLAELRRRAPLRELRVRVDAADELDRLAEAGGFDLPALSLERRAADLEEDPGYLHFPGPTPQAPVYRGLPFGPRFARLSLGDPLRRLDLGRWPPEDVPLLADMPQLSGLKSLRADAQNPQAVFALVSARHLRSLGELVLTSSSLGSGGALVVARGAPRPLERLEITRGGIDVAAFDALFSSGALASLTELGLSHSRVAFQGARALGRSPHLQRLRALDLREAWIGPDGLSALLASRTLPALERLDVSETPLYGWGLADALGKANVATLRRLGLAGCNLDRDGAGAIASASALARLEHLDVSDNALGGKGAAVLGDAALPLLRELRAQCVGAGRRALEALGASPVVARLVALSIGERDDEAGALAFLRGESARGLRRLTLHARALGSDLARALGELPALRELDLHLSDKAAPVALADGAFPALRRLTIDAFDDPAAERFAASDAAPLLHTLHIDGRLSDAGATALERALRLESLARFVLRAPIPEAAAERLRARLGYRFTAIVPYD